MALGRWFGSQIRLQLLISEAGIPDRFDSG
jgi:hypothetical protein